MGKKPEVGRRVCTEEEIAEVLNGFEEEMLADLYRRREEELSKRPKAKVLEFPAKLGEQEPLRRQQVIDQALERINEQRRQQGLPSLEMARQMRSQMEAVPASAKKVVSEWDPMKKFGESCHRGPLDSDSDL